MTASEKQDLVAAGRRALAQATRDMPVLASIREEFVAKRPLAGARFAGCLHLTKETGVLIELLQDAGAEIVWTGGDEVSTQDEVAAALCERGVTVFGWRDMRTQEVERALKETLHHFAAGPTIVIDNGARLVKAVIEAPERFADLDFLTEKTTEGCADLREIAARRPMPFPIFLVNDVVTKWEVDNTFGTGQSTVDGILRATGRLLAGKVFAVCGFGHVGRGVAMRAAGQGARVIVVCRSLETAIKATLAGYRVLPLEKAIAAADILCTATGRPDIVRMEHLLHAKDGIVLCNTGHSVTEIDVAAIEAAATEKTVRSDLITAYRLPSGRTLEVIARGGLVNLAAARGNPSEVMDVTFSNQVLSVLRAHAARGRLERGLHEVPEEQDEDVALRKLAAMGLSCDAARRPAEEETR